MLVLTWALIVTGFAALLAAASNFSGPLGYVKNLLITLGVLILMIAGGVLLGRMLRVALFD